ncbi:C8orf37 protein [Polychytrium aggregatum]|uniref:C8orf37 protein n=1 Tax=Polychytrium aggregatum TaxID=110093 RepID=UPI0022FF4495|nr:C8orf37 protein [Polychytrium aggregatum]KAI9204796.1 C8orf37 protein [Polychytrium aggregatum]
MPLTHPPLPKRCNPVCIGGTSIDTGLTVMSAMMKSCDRLRCLSCDFKCIRFDDAVWDDGLVSYLFFRNFMPDVAKLRKGIKFRKGHVCFCCQCSWCGIGDEAKALSSVAQFEKAKWVCGGH